MPLLKLIFGRRSDRDQPKPSDQPGNAANSAAPAPQPVVAAVNTDAQATNAAPHGQARKIGRPSTTSRPQPRPDRVSSRLMKYGQLDAVLDELDDRDAPGSRPISRPVGWLVIIEGPGTGAWFTLQSGLSSIGRADDQTVCLNYGDGTISRSIHASVSYEPADHRFRLGQGRCENDVLINGVPVVETVDLHHGDLITVGETTLRLAAFCDDRFAWAPIIDKGDANALSA